MAMLELRDLNATRRLGKIIAALACQKPLPPLLLHGALGSGKTSLTAEIVRQLPGGEEAETSSPSFTICNIYPTMPPVLHCDLYRCRSHAPDEIWDFMADGAGLLIIEWAEYLQPTPSDYLDIFLEVADNKRLVAMQGIGLGSAKIAKQVEELWRTLEANPQA